MRPARANTEPIHIHFEQALWPLRHFLLARLPLLLGISSTDPERTGCNVADILRNFVHALNTAELYTPEEIGYL